MSISIAETCQEKSYVKVYVTFVALDIHIMKVLFQKTINTKEENCNYWQNKSILNYYPPLFKDVKTVVLIILLLFTEWVKKLLKSKHDGAFDNEKRCKENK